MIRELIDSEMEMVAGGHFRCERREWFPAPSYTNSNNTNTTTVTDSFNGSTISGGVNIGNQSNGG